MKNKTLNKKKIQTSWLWAEQYSS